MKLKQKVQIILIRCLMTNDASLNILRSIWFTACSNHFVKKNHKTTSI